MSELPALIIYPALGLLQVAGYQHGGYLHYRTGEARNYEAPNRYRGPFAIFGSRDVKYGAEHLGRTRHFPRQADRERFLACAARWSYRLIGLAELVSVHEPGSKHYDRAFAGSLCRPELRGETLIYETRPVPLSLTDPDVAPRFDECCLGCLACRSDPARLRNHQISSHVRWQRVRLPRR